MQHVGLLFSWPGIRPIPVPQWKGGVLTTEPPGWFLLINSWSVFLSVPWTLKQMYSFQIFSEYMHVPHTSTIYNSQDIEATPLPISR